MDFFRIGDKVVSKNKVYRIIDRILFMRSQGRSQREISEEIGVDRSFISRVENLGEIRKSKSIGVVGFPIKNKDEILELLKRYGIDNCLIMNEAERLSFVKDRSGSQLVNDIIRLVGEYRNFDTVVVMASDMRTKLLETLLNQQVITLDIGRSPITEDVHVDAGKVEEILEILTSKDAANT